MQESPLRELMESHHGAVKDRFDGLDARLDRMEQRLEHTHPEKVSWSSYVGTALPALTAIVGLILIIAG